MSCLLKKNMEKLYIYITSILIYINFFIYNTIPQYNIYSLKFESNKLFSLLIKIFVEEYVQVTLDHNRYCQIFQKVTTLCVYDVAYDRSKDFTFKHNSPRSPQFTQRNSRRSLTRDTKYIHVYISSLYFRKHT